MPFSISLRQDFNVIMKVLEERKESKNHFIKGITSLPENEQAFLLTNKDNNGHNSLLKAALFYPEMLPVLLEMLLKLNPEIINRVLETVTELGQNVLTILLTAVKTSNSYGREFENLQKFLKIISQYCNFYTLQSSSGDNALMQLLTVLDLRSFPSEYVLSKIDELPQSIKINLFTAVDINGNNALMQSIQLQLPRVTHSLIDMIARLPSESIKNIFCTKNLLGENATMLVQKKQVNTQVELILLSAAIVNIDYDPAVYDSIGYKLTQFETLIRALSIGANVSRPFRALKILGIEEKIKFLTTKFDYSLITTEEMTLLEFIIAVKNKFSLKNNALEIFIQFIKDSAEADLLLKAIFSVLNPFDTVTKITDALYRSQFDFFLDAALRLCTAEELEKFLSQSNISASALALTSKPEGLLTYLNIIAGLDVDRRESLFTSTNSKTNLLTLVLRSPLFSPLWSTEKKETLLIKLLEILKTLDIEFRQKFIAKDEDTILYNILCYTPKLLPNYFQVIKEFSAQTKFNHFSSLYERNQNPLLLAIKFNMEQFISSLNDELMHLLFTSQYSVTGMSFFMTAMLESRDKSLRALDWIKILPQAMQIQIFLQKNSLGKNILFQALNPNLSKKILESLLTLITDLPIEDKKTILSSKFDNQSFLEYAHDRLDDKFDQFFPPSIVAFSLTLQLSMAEKSPLYKEAFKANLAQRITQLTPLDSSPEIKLIRKRLASMRIKADLKKATILDELELIRRADNEDSFYGKLNRALTDPQSPLSQALGQKRITNFLSPGISSSSKQSRNIPKSGESLDDLIANRYPLNTPDGKKLVGALLNNPTIKHKLIFETYLEALLQMPKAEANDISYLFSICVKIHFSNFLNNPETDYEVSYLKVLAEKVRVKGYKIDLRITALNILINYKINYSTNIDAPASQDILRLYKATLTDDLFKTHHTLGGILSKDTAATLKIKGLIANLEKNVSSALRIIPRAPGNSGDDEGL